MYIIPSVGWNFIDELFSSLIYIIYKELATSIVAYPSLQILFNKNYAGNILLSRLEVYKLCVDREKNFHELDRIIKLAKMYVYFKKFVFTSFYSVLIFRVFDKYFSPAKKKKILVSFYPQLMFNLFGPLYFGLNKMIKYYNEGIYVSNKYFSPSGNKKYSLLFYPKLIFNLLKPLYFGLNKIIKYYNTGIYISTDSFKIIK